MKHKIGRPGELTANREAPGKTGSVGRYGELVGGELTRGRNDRHSGYAPPWLSLQ